MGGGERLHPSIQRTNLLAGGMKVGGEELSWLRTNPSFGLSWAAPQNQAAPIVRRPHSREISLREEGRSKMFQVDTGLQDGEEPLRSFGVIHKGLSLLFWLIVKRQGLWRNPAFLCYQRDSEVQNQMLIRKSSGRNTGMQLPQISLLSHVHTHREREFY